MPRKKKMKKDSGSGTPRTGFVYEMPLRLTLQVYGKGVFVSLRKFAEDELVDAGREAFAQEGFLDKCYFDDPLGEGQWMALKVQTPILLDGTDVDFTNCRKLFMASEPNATPKAELDQQQEGSST